jgi:thioredoxin 1
LEKIKNTMAKSSFNKLIQSEIPLLIDFYADWCGPCKSFAPVLKELKEEMGDNVKIIKINVDKNQSLSKKLDVMGVPTVMIFKKGELKWQTTGMQTKQALLLKLKEAM